MESKQKEVIKQELVLPDDQVESLGVLAKLVRDKAENAIRVFLISTMGAHFPELEEVTLYQLDEGKVVAEYVTPAKRLIVAEFLFYESRTVKILGTQTKDAYNHKIWVFQATSAWIEFINQLLEKEKKS
jgi:hypothetical protein